MSWVTPYQCSEPGCKSPVRTPVGQKGTRCILCRQMSLRLFELRRNEGPGVASPERIEELARRYEELEPLGISPFDEVA